MRRSQAARSRRERDVRAQAGKGAASPNHTVYIGTVANLKYCALPGGGGGGAGGGGAGVLRNLAIYWHKNHEHTVARIGI